MARAEAGDFTKIIFVEMSLVETAMKYCETTMDGRAARPFAAAAGSGPSALLNHNISLREQ